MEYMIRQVIELIRVSTEGQAAPDRASIPAQRTENRRTAARHGLTIVQTIEIADVCGAAVLHAPEMKQLLELMKSPDIHGVVAKEFSRLMRPENFDDFSLLQHFANTKTLLYLPDGPIDLGSKMGRVMGGLRALFSGLEREEIRERSWSAKEEKRRRGENPQGAITLPFGVSWSPKEGWTYTPEAELVREAFRLFLSGQTSYSEIAKRTGLNRFNVPVILRNPIYTGWRVIDERRDSSAAALRVKPDGRQADRPKIARAPEEVIRVRVLDEPLVNEADFAMAQEIMARKRVRHWRAKPEYKSPYTYHGHLLCDECGELVYSYSNARGGHYYVCKAKQYPKLVGRKCLTPYMRREELESNIDKALGTRLTDRAFLERLVADYERRRQNPDAKANVERLQQRFNELADKRQRTLSTFFDGKISVLERDSYLETIESETAICKELLGRVAIQPPVSVDALADACSVFVDWEFLNPAAKRRILAITLPEISVVSSEVKELTVNLHDSRHDEINHRGRDSWRRRA